MGYRPRTNDYVMNGKVFDLYGVTIRKNGIQEKKNKAKKRYKYVRVLKRKGEYQIWVAE